jgi:hypothetical protein
MKKTLNLIIVLVLTISCNSQNSNNKSLINDFIEEIIFNKKPNIEVLNKYIDFNDSSLSDKKYEIVKFNIEFLHREIDAKDYEILTYKEFKKEKLFEDYKMHYVNLSNVYCIVSRDKYITMFVIEDNRVLAFFTGIIKNKDRVTPYMLNE